MIVELQAQDVDGPEGLTVALFTKDMVETLLRFFGAYQRDGVVTLQLTAGGRLWLVNPHDDTRQFLGQAVLSEQEEQARLRRLKRQVC